MNTYVVAKLLSGEEFISILFGEDDMVYRFLYPLKIRTMSYQSNNMITEQAALTEFCSLTDESLFTIKKSNVLFCKTVTPLTIKLYKETLHFIKNPPKPEINDSIFYSSGKRLLH